MVSPAAKVFPLDEARVLDAAFEVLEAHGFAGLTIRRIADRLGVKNPALYWHFRNKQEIVNRMASRLLDRMTAAPLEAGDWRSWLRDAAKWYRQTLLGVRDGAEILSNANLSRSRHFAEFQRGIAYLAAQGFSDRDALIGMVTVFDYALGVTYEHQADARIAASGAADAPSLAAPMFAPLGGLVRDAAREALFEGGLELILDGLTLRRAG
jgi:TetR/AcrR family tetracycline transcriptional repressor